MAQIFQIMQQQDAARRGQRIWMEVGTPMVASGMALTVFMDREAASYIARLRVQIPPSLDRTSVMYRNGWVTPLGLVRLLGVRWSSNATPAAVLVELPAPPGCLKAQ